MTRQEIIAELEKHDPNIILVEMDKSDDELKEMLQVARYPQRRIDGQRFSDMQGAKLVVLDAPREVKKEISEFFARSQGFLAMGWWNSALDDLQAKSANAYVDQELLDEVKNYMIAYIAQSYEL